MLKHIRRSRTLLFGILIRMTWSFGQESSCRPITSPDHAIRAALLQPHWFRSLWAVCGRSLACTSTVYPTFIDSNQSCFSETEYPLVHDRSSSPKSESNRLQAGDNRNLAKFGLFVPSNQFVQHSHVAWQPATKLYSIAGYTIAPLSVAHLLLPPHPHHYPARVRATAMWNLVAST